MNEILIYVKGGMVQEVRAKFPCEVFVWDDDSLENEDEDGYRPFDVDQYDDLNTKFPEVVF